MKCRLAWRRALVVAAAAMVTTVAPALSAAPAGASDAPLGAAVVLFASAVPGQLPGSGGTVTVTGRVKDAAYCQLVVLSSQTFPVVYSHNPKGCSDGQYSAHVTVGPSSALRPRTVALALVARNRSSSYTGRFYVRLAGLPSTAVLSAQAAPEALPPAGATVVVTGRVKNATSCRLVLLSSEPFPVVYSHNPKNCVDGLFTARVTIGPNPAVAPESVAFALVADNSASTYAGRFYVVLKAARAAPNQVPATTTAPFEAPSVPVTQSQSSNWSGYAAVGGPYTVVRGTFTVPTSLGEGGFGAQVSEWVGLDGLGQGDSSLVQAGVEEAPGPASSTGFDIQPWWEILPAAETDITDVTVNPGDKVSVAIWKIGPTSWEINLSDATDGQSFTSPPEQYSGDGSSAEWIVEATTECEFRCRTAQLAPFDPPVAFTGTAMTGPPEKSLQEITMDQYGQAVSTPSALVSGHFTVSYTGFAGSN